MLESLNKIGEAAKNAVIFILTPFAVVGVIIYMLLTKNRELESEVEASKSKEKLNELEGKKEQVDLNADAIVKQYREHREAYLREHADSLRPGSDGSAGTDQDPGPDAGSGGDSPSG